MEQGAQRPLSVSKDALKKKYAKKLLTQLKTRGFSHLRIDDIVKKMDISKATFYKHFSSKEEVLNEIVDLFVSHIKEAAEQIQDTTFSYEQRFQVVFKQSIFMTSFISEAFLCDLEYSYQELWERFRSAQQHYNGHLQEFYEQGIALGIFQAINPLLLVVQGERILRIIMDPVFLVEHDLTLRKALYDFYVLQKYLVLTPDARVALNDTPIEGYIDMMAHKFSSSMH